MTSSLISVIMPVYNARQFLKQSVDSVLKQTYPHIELLLVDDGSTDDSLAVCREYAAHDTRVKVYSQPNGGPAAARNTGMMHATGAFVFFLDADDLIDQKAFETLIAAHDKHHPDLVMGNFCKKEVDGRIVEQAAVFSPDGNPFAGDLALLTKEDIDSYVRHFLKHPSNHLISYCWGRLYDLSIIKKNNIAAHGDMRLFEDYVFNLNYLRYCTTVAFVNKPLLTYVMHPAHVSASMAIINGESLVHDMLIFKTETQAFFKGSDQEYSVRRQIGHTLTHYVIIFLIRSSRLANKATWNQIRREVSIIINSAIFKESMRYYAPAKGNSRILPMLAKLRLVDLIIYYCRYKANRRYGKIKN